MCVTEYELAKRKREHLSEFKKRKEHVHRDGTKKPRKTRAPSMTYACACHTMRTLCGDIASTTCIECKVRGYVTITNGNPDCKSCMCKCNTGVFVFSDIEKMNLKLATFAETSARKSMLDVDKQSRESLGNIFKNSIKDGISLLSTSGSEMSEDNVMVATAAAMSRRQFKSKELMHSVQKSLFGKITTKMCSTGEDVHDILNFGWKESR